MTRWIATTMVAIVTIHAATSCSRASDANRRDENVASHGVRRLVAPDVSDMAPSVQEQLRRQWDAVARIQTDPAGSPIDRQASTYGEFGRLLIAADALGDAEAALLNANHLRPDDFRWVYYLAQVYRLQGQSPAAGAYFERALRIRSDDVPSLVWLGNVYVDQGRFGEARALFERALRGEPRAAAARAGLGRVALATKDYRGAIAQLEAALALDRSATGLHYPLAAAYRGIGEVDRAAAHERQRGTVQIGPPDPLMQEVADMLRSPAIYETRGDRALARGEFNLAVTHFRAGLELAPDSLNLRQKLATALSLSGDVPASVTQLQEILRRSPTYASAHYSLGVLWLGSGRTDLAIESFGRAVRSDPTYLQARLQLAHALRARKRFAEARQQYQEVLERDPRVGEAFFGDAIARADAGDYADARSRFEEGAKLYPDRTEFVVALVRLEAAAPDARVRDGSRALAHARDLVRRQRSPSSCEAMAMALAEAHQFDAAAMWQRDAIAMAERSGLHDDAVAMDRNRRLFEARQPSRAPWWRDPEWEP